jgi:DNA topoisomerase-3
LNENETRIYDLVVKRFLAVFYPAAEYLNSTRITRVGLDAFRTEGRVLVSPGWLEVYGRGDAGGDIALMPPLALNKESRCETVEVVANSTKPPSRFTEATLLSTMESAGKLVDDEELREALRAKGLGTPATRAAIIEGLITEKYINREGRDLAPTAKAFSLLRLLRALEINELCSAELTGDWEFKLRQMEQGRLARPEFMSEIVSMTKRIVGRVKGHEGDTIPGQFGTLKTSCPKCGGEVRESYRNFACQSCDFVLWRNLAGREFDLSEAEQLLQEKRIGPLANFRSKAGRPFAAAVKLNAEWKTEFEFSNVIGEGDATPDFSALEQVGRCPVCSSVVYADSLAYACEKALARPRSCSFRLGRSILQREIELAEAKKLLTEGRTSLLSRFMSKKGRPFAAFLVLGDGGKVGFEFAPSNRSTSATNGSAGKANTLRGKRRAGSS